MSRIEYDLRPGKDYCGYCKADYDEQGKCNCNGRGAPVESIGSVGTVTITFSLTWVAGVMDLVTP